MSLARQFGLEGKSVLEQPVKKAEVVPDKKSTGEKKAVAEKALSKMVTLSGNKEIYKQRIDVTVIEAMKRLEGSPAHNLQQAMIEYCQSKGVL